jgi:DNA-binding GntR family transcriptional regulator
LETKPPTISNEGKNRPPYQTKQQMAYDIIRSKILDGTYKPQQHLKMVDLTKEIGISSIPIREALKQLEDEGLVKFNLHRGVQVFLYSPEEFGEIYMIRAVLEGLAGKLGTQNITEIGIKRMKELLEQMNLALEKNNLQEKFQTLSQLHYEFHQVLYRAANCPRLNKMIINLWGNTHDNATTNLISKCMPDFYERIQKGHIAIVEAVTARLPELVKQLIEDSFELNRKVFVEYLKNPGNFMGGKSNSLENIDPGDKNDSGG